MICSYYAAALAGADTYHYDSYIIMYMMIEIGVCFIIIISAN